MKLICPIFCNFALNIIKINKFNIINQENEQVHVFGRRFVRRNGFDKLWIK